MKERTEAKRLIEEYGADLLDMSHPGVAMMDVNVWSPVGSMWKATGCHSLTAYNYTDARAGWTWLLNELRTGMEPCDNKECETCNDVQA